MYNKTRALAAVPLVVASLVVHAGAMPLNSRSFLVNIGSESGGIASLKRTGDAIDTNFVWPGKVIGDLVIKYRLPGAAWSGWESSASGAVRTVTAVSPESVAVAHASAESAGNAASPLAVDESYTLQGNALVWNISIRNRYSSPVEIGDLGLPLPFATDYKTGSKAIFNSCVIRHSFISGDSSFIFCERPSGVGPYLVMTPLPGTHLEYYTDRQRTYTAYIHAKVQANETDAGSTWRQPVSSKTLAAAESAGDHITYGFKFTWAKDYDAVRQTLVREGLIDVRAVPGMVIPRGMPAMFSLKTRQRIRSIDAEFPGETTVRLVDSSKPDTRPTANGRRRQDGWN